MCASSAREEEQWRSILLEYSAKEHLIRTENCVNSPFLTSILTLDIRSLGYIFGLPGTLTHRISIQRAGTIGSKTSNRQVIIRNTNTLKDHEDSKSSALDSISRSQSLLSTNRIQILAPKRAERLRMESALSSVWTKDLLPYPGMSPNRGELSIRSSASSVLRKLSRASRANNFKKRSASCASIIDNKTALIPSALE